MISLFAQATLPEGLADIREPVDIFVMPWLLLGVLAALSLLGYAIYRWRKHHKANVPAAPPEPPLVRARRTLDALRAKAGELSDKGLSVEASDLLRAFIEDAFRLPAGERTTEEFLPEVSSDPRFSKGVRTELGAFLNQVDLVKFAAQGLTPTQRDDLLNAVGAFFDAAEPVLAAQAEPTAQANSGGHA